MVTRSPNIVFILIDDLGWRDLGCYGSGFYETPRLDRLAAEGMRFTDAYASCPVCSPTRASLLTGKYPARVGVTQYIGGHAVGRLCDVPYFHCLPQSERSVARDLREAGRPFFLNLLHYAVHTPIEAPADLEHGY
jgi:arylsulfatase A-like enzyme